MTSATATIRAATVKDVAGLVGSYEWLAAPPGRRPADWTEDTAVAALQRVIHSSRSTVLVAALDGELVGFLTVYLDIESVRFGRRAWIEDLAVHPEHRSRGIGRMLLEGAKQWARKRGASHIELESGEDRIDAHRFYEMEGPSERSKCYSWRL